MKIEITPRQMHDAFYQAEGDTSVHFGQDTCSMKTIEGKHECPICYFHIQYRKYLGINEVEYQKALKGKW